MRCTLLALAAALGLAACGGSVAPEAGETGLEPAPWRLAEEPQARSVLLVYTTDECVRTPGEDTAAETAARFERAEVQSSGEAVTITVLLRRAQSDEGVACGAAPVAVRRTVTLPEPIAGRVLRDGSTSPPTPVRPPN